jgi:type IV pilus assembly protein PilN
MRININLASNPYEAAREYARRMTMLLGVLVLVTVGLVGYILYQRGATRDVDHQISQTRQELASLDGEKTQAQSILNQPQNRDVADQAAFLNNLFARKALSWTQVFTQMEKLMPANIHVVSMKPEFNRDNQLVLRVVVVTPSREKAVELVRHMEASPHFRSPRVESENAVGDSSTGVVGGNTQFEIAAVYVPYSDDSEVTPEEAPAKKAGKKSAANTPGVAARTEGGR